jgi:preprotein translocase subunit SecF
MNISKHLAYFFILPAILSLAALTALGVWGLRPGIDISGGSLLQVTYLSAQADVERPSVSELSSALEPLGLGEMRIQPANTASYIIRTKALTAEQHQALLATLQGLGNAKEDQFTTVGPTIGGELLQKAWIAIVLVVLCTILFIAFAFRGVSKPVASWKYGVVAIVTLLHDILVPAGLFAALGYFVGAEVDALFIVALLTILGISINDTIVIFDRIRENLRLNEEHGKKEEFESLVEKSIRQTVARSINTSLTVIIVLVALYIVGPEATKYFALTLIVGMVAGTYSSIFLASPLLVVWQKLQKK